MIIVGNICTVFLLVLLYLGLRSSSASSNQKSEEPAPISNFDIFKHDAAHRSTSLNNIENFNILDNGRRVYYNKSEDEMVNIFTSGMVDRDDYDPHHLEPTKLIKNGRKLGAALGDPSLVTNLYPNIDPNFVLTYEPRMKSFSPTALGVSVFCKTQPSAKIYYTISTFYQVGGRPSVVTYPTIDENRVATQSSPYIHIDTPYLASRNTSVIFVGIYTDYLGKVWRTQLYEIPYFVEASNRPAAAMFLVPGIESRGNFLRVEIEVKAKARAQTAGGQEFSDFFTKLGSGPYDKQVQALHLPSLNEEFNGYEGGVSYKGRDQNHYGIIVPYHNGMKFHGWVIRVNLRGMANAAACLANYRIETLYNTYYKYYANSLPYNASHRIRVETPAGDITWTDSPTISPSISPTVEPTAMPTAKAPLKPSRAPTPNPTNSIKPSPMPTASPTNTPVSELRGSACTFAMKLHDIDNNARGFKRGFLDDRLNPNYMYLAPGEYATLIRIDIHNFGLDTVKAVNLDDMVPDLGLGGYSGGFKDGHWACFVPLRTFFGPVGGYRSKLEVDKFHLRHYYHGRVLCFNESGFLNAKNPTIVRNAIRTIELSDFSPELRGFSDAVRVGRYAYLSPYEYEDHVYTGKTLRIDLGIESIGHTIDAAKAAGLPVSTLLNVLDLAKIYPGLMGFSGIFTAGQYVYLVPLRNTHEPINGQRGHGNFVRINMNDFSLKGVEYIDIPTTTRTQIPSFADTDLRGFSYGIASGKYGILVPFYNAIFSGKCARLVLFGAEGLADNLQELDLVQDYYGRIMQKNGECSHCDNSFKFKGFRGGFVSLWPGVSY